MPVQSKLFSTFKLPAAGLVVCLVVLSAVAGCVAPVRTTGKFAEKQCLDCHTEFKSKYFSMSKVHAVVKEQKCEDCHLKHGILPKLLLKEQGNRLCLTCHKAEQIGMDKKKAHTALQKGKCIDCHNPHASNQSHLLNAAGNDLCFRCHQSAQFNKTVVHQALKKETCLRCHFSHSSDQADLLRDQSVTLCRSCHDIETSAFKKAHHNYRVGTADCNGCHNPHAALQPGLMKTSVHAPVVKDACDACHNPAGTPQSFDTVKKGRDLCLQCHKTADLMNGSVAQHQPFQQGKCLECHQPHASEALVLLQRPGNALCFGCHTEKQTKPATPHKAISEGKGCLSCHVRHAGPQAKLLAGPEQAVCLECHPRILLEKKTFKPHQPFVEGTCSKCHNAHGSNNYGMLRAKTSSVCYSCHFEAEPRFMKTNTHRPVLDGNCYECHRSHGGKMQKLLPVAADDPKLCSKCHAELMQPVQGGSNHQFFKEGKCLRCHDVHASNVPGMITTRQGFLCNSCHGTDPGREITAPKSKHTPVVEGQCTRCHSPHKANLGRLLLADYPDLCLACHVELKKKMAPGDAGAAGRVKAPVPDAAAETLEDGTRIYLHSPPDLKRCNLCHQPHYAAEPALASKPIQQLCADCHDYQKRSFQVAHIDIAGNLMDCSRCHDAHASTDPKLFKADIHQPFAERKCKDCHITE
jgi:predicted CXXCH cytochrome family protein